MEHNGNTTVPLETLGVPAQVLLVSLYSFTAAIAFISNLVTILVLVKGRRCTRDLRKFLINLCVADMAMALFTIPFTYTNYMFGRWIFLPVMCSLVNFAQLTSITVSIYTLVAIGIDRYFAIMHPLQRSISWFKSHRALIVIFVWVLGISIGLTQIWVSKTGTFIHNGSEYTSCGERWEPYSAEGQLYTVFIFVITFALPMSVLCIVYSAMGCRLLRYQMPGQLQQHHGSGSSLKSPEQSDLFAEGHSGQLNNGAHFRRSNGAGRMLLNGSNKARLLKVSNGEAANCSLHNQQHGTFSNEPQESQMKQHKQQKQNKASGTSTGTAQGPLLGGAPIVSVYGEKGEESEEEENESTCDEEYQHSRGGLAPLQEKSAALQNNGSERRQNLKPPTSNQAQGKTQYRSVKQQPLRLDSHSSNGSNVQNSSRKIIIVRRNKVLRMLITIIGVFLICWLPIQLFSILVYFSPDFLAVTWNTTKYYAFVCTYFLCHWVSCAHSAVNPLLYSFLSKNFRDDVRYLFGRFWHLYILRKEHFRPTYSTYSSHFMHNGALNRTNHVTNNFFDLAPNSAVQPSVPTPLDDESSQSSRPKVQFQQQNSENSQHFLQAFSEQTSQEKGLLSTTEPTEFHLTEVHIVGVEHATGSSQHRSVI